MKKVIFIILIMFPFLVYADCDYEKFNEHTKLANNITYEVNYYTGEKKFGVVLYNVYDGIYVTYNNSIYNADDENIVFIGNIPQGEFLKISVYSPVEECNSFIRTINVSVGYYNNYYDDPRCSKYKDILNICSNKYLEYEPNEDLLESTIKNYKSTFKEEKKTEKIISMKKEDTKKKQKKEEEEEEEEEEEVEEEVEEEEQDIVGEDFAKDPRAFSYLQDAGRIADEVLQNTLSQCKPSANIYNICQASDALIREKLSKIYTKKKFIKGIAFPTCISVNEVCGNYAPTGEESGDEHQYNTLSEGDVAKVSLGVEINGFAALAGHTIVVSDKKEKITGQKADVILAAYKSIQTALRLMTKENTNNKITDTISKICQDYKVNPIEGVLSHRMKRDIIDGLETIINKSTIDQKVDERKFEHGDVFGLAVIVSTGEGKPKETTIKTSIYKRALETTYKLRTDSGRKLLSVVENNFYSFPFSFSAFDKEENIKLKQKIPNFKTTMKMGLGECVKNDLLHGYPVLTEKKGEIVAEFTYTIAVRNEGPIVISGLNLDLDQFESDKKITDEEIVKELEKDLDNYLPNYKRTKKEEKKKKKDNKAKRAAKKAAKKRRQEEAKKKREEEGK